MGVSKENTISPVLMSLCGQREHSSLQVGFLAGHNGPQVEQDMIVHDPGNDRRVGVSQGSLDLIRCQPAMSQRNQHGWKTRGRRRASADRRLSRCSFQFDVTVHCRQANSLDKCPGAFFYLLQSKSDETMNRNFVA